MLGIPKMRSIAFSCPYWGPPIWESNNYVQLATRSSCRSRFKTLVETRSQSVTVQRMPLTTQRQQETPCPRSRGTSQACAIRRHQYKPLGSTWTSKILITIALNPKIMGVQASISVCLAGSSLPKKGHPIDANIL